MKLFEILLFEDDSLDVFFNSEEAILAYRDVRIPIYRVVDSGDGVIFEPISPWGGQPLYTDEHDPDIAWGQVKKTIEQSVIHAFQNMSPRAKRTWRRIDKATKSR